MIFKIYNDIEVLIDDDDFFKVKYHNWSCTKAGYAARTENGKTIFMHRLIAETPNDLYTDHINGNQLDNRKCNLRICTHQQNMFNAKKQKGKNGKKCTSIYKGVSWNKNNKNWFSHIRINNKSKYIGSFVCEKEAAKAYNNMALKYHGDFSRLNIIED